MKKLILVVLFLTALLPARAQSPNTGGEAASGTAQQDLEPNTTGVSVGDTPPAPATYLGHIRGMVFNDRNRNCIKDQNEAPLRDQVLEANPGHFVVATDSLGQYDFNLPYGSYQISHRLTSQWNHICPVTGFSPILQVNDTVPAINGFYFSVAENTYHDIAIYGASNQARPGFDLTYIANLSNIGTIGQTALVQFVPDGISQIISIPGLRPDSARGDTLFWRMDAPAHADRTVKVQTRLPADVNLIGMELRARFEIVQAHPDTNTANNIAVIKNVISGSYDPNDKSVDPPGNITASDSMLTYLIRFQNTGNDTAFTVAVRDTISQNLDLSSIRTLIASHTFSFKIESERAVEWRFDRIRLVDSNRNEDRSHGFVKFSIKRNKGLTIGNAIHNRAFIFFDFNPPVPTNTVQNMLVADRPELPGNAFQGKAAVVPNPVRNQAVIRLNGSTAKGSGVLSVTDGQGRPVLQKSKLSGAEFRIQSPGKAGIYFVQIREGGHMLGQTRFIAE